MKTRRVEAAARRLVRSLAEVSGGRQQWWASLTEVAERVSIEPDVALEAAAFADAQGWIGYHPVAHSISLKEKERRLAARTRL